MFFDTPTTPLKALYNYIKDKTPLWLQDEDGNHDEDITRLDVQKLVLATILLKTLIKEKKAKPNNINFMRTCIFNAYLFNKSLEEKPNKSRINTEDEYLDIYKLELENFLTAGIAKFGKISLADMCRTVPTYLGIFSSTLHDIIYSLYETTFTKNAREEELSHSKSKEMLANNRLFRRARSPVSSFTPSLHSISEHERTHSKSF